MQSQYTYASPAAIIGGMAAAGGAIALLTRDGFTSGWTVELALRPLLAVLTILCGHLAVRALWRGRLLSFALLAVLAVSGSAMLVYEAMGTRAEIRDAKVATATESEGQREHWKQMLAEAEENVTRHRQRESAECASGRGTRCTGASYTVKTWEAAVAGYEAKIKGLGAPKPIDPKGERIAAIAGMLGISASAVAIQRNVAMLEPLMLPLFLELSSIALLGYGFGRGRRREEAPQPAKEATTFERPLTDEEIEEIKRLILGAGQPLSNGELARRLGISAGETSKRVANGVALGILQKHRVGREVAISSTRH